MFGRMSERTAGRKTRCRLGLGVPTVANNLNVLRANTKLLGDGRSCVSGLEFWSAHLKLPVTKPLFMLRCTDCHMR